jgi:hypothetical protein
VPGSEGHIWVALYGNGLTRSVNSGQTFTKVSNVTNCSAVGVGKADKGATYPTIYIWGTVGGITGVYRSTDQGANWVRINDDQHQYGGLANGQYVIGDMNVFGRVYMSTAGRGVAFGSTYDCNGDLGGSAYYDNCTDCVMGNTGQKPCTKDCNGDYGGKATIDDCKKCSGGNTGIKPCVTSVGEVHDVPFFTLSANPFIDAIRLQVKLPVEYKIYALTGALKESGFCYGFCNIGSSVSPGFYLLSINNHDEIKKVKIIKSNL